MSDKAPEAHTREQMIARARKSMRRRTEIRQLNKHIRFLTLFRNQSWDQADKARTECKRLKKILAKHKIPEYSSEDFGVTYEKEFRQALLLFRWVFGVLVILGAWDVYFHWKQVFP